MNDLSSYSYQLSDSISSLISNSISSSLLINKPSSFIWSNSILTTYINTNSYNYYNNSLIEEILKNKTNIKKEEIVQNIKEIINIIEIGKDYKLNGEDFTLIIKPTNSSFLQNTTHVDFIKCEEILRNTLNISSDRILTFLQMEINNKNNKSLINQLEYQVYDDNKNILDLSICNDTNIKIFYALKNNILDPLFISNFKKSGIDIFNIKDSFFNDICKPYSISKNDLVLEDRIKDIYQNYSLCESECNYNELNIENMTVSCSCNIKTNISINESSLNLEKFDNINIESNFGIIKCYKLVFSFNDKLNNIGFWIFIFLVGIQIPLLINYCYKGIGTIKNYIINEMIKFGYITKGNITNKKINNKKRIKNQRYLSKNKKKVNNPPPKNKKIKKKSKIKNKINKNRLMIGDNNMELINNSSSEHNKSSNAKIVNKMNTLRELNIENEKKINGDINKKRRKSKKKKKFNITSIKTKENIDKIATEGNTHINDKKDKILFNFCLINIDLNNKNDYRPKNSNFILNNYTYEEAIKHDMRSICAIFYIFLLSKQVVCHTFLFKSPLELFSLRLCLLIFIISSDLALNAFFYLDDKISKKYKYAKGLFLFTFNNNITIILLSTLIGFLFMTFFTNLSNLTNNIKGVFLKEEEKIKKNKNYVISEKRKVEIFEEIENILKKYKIKVIILITIEIILMLFFGYYVTAFCHVYSSTQLSWLFDSFLSILSRLVIELLISLGFAKLYRIAVEANSESIYKFVLFFYCFG